MCALLVYCLAFMALKHALVSGIDTQSYGRDLVYWPEGDIDYHKTMNNGTYLEYLDFCVNVIDENATVLIINSSKELNFIRHEVLNGESNETYWIGLMNKENVSYWENGNTLFIPREDIEYWGINQSFVSEKNCTVLSADGNVYPKSCDLESTFICRQVGWTKGNDSHNANGTDASTTDMEGGVSNTAFYTSRSYTDSSLLNNCTLNKTEDSAEIAKLSWPFWLSLTLLCLVCLASTVAISLLVMQIRRLRNALASHEFTRDEDDKYLSGIYEDKTLEPSAKRNRSLPQLPLIKVTQPEPLSTGYDIVDHAREYIQEYADPVVLLGPDTSDDDDSYASIPDGGSVEDTATINNDNLNNGELQLIPPDKVIGPKGDVYTKIKKLQKLNSQDVVISEDKLVVDESLVIHSNEKGNLNLTYDEDETEILENDIYT